MTGRYSFGGENLINLGTSSWKDKLDKTDQVEKKNQSDVATMDMVLVFQGYITLGE